jgi:hypothetical protein
MACVSETRFTRLVVACAIVAYVVAVVVLRGGVGLGGAMVLAIWSTTPVFWWATWALIHKARGKDQRDTLLFVGGLVGLGYAVLLLVLRTIPDTESSTAVIGYFTLPLLLLFFTIVTTMIGGAAVRSATRREQPLPVIVLSPAETEAQAMARDLARIDAKRAERANRKRRR